MVLSSCGRVIADHIRIADTFFSRFMGLMGRKTLGCGEGLLLMDCPSIHCFFMKITIDAVYLSRDMTILGIETLEPWSIGRQPKGTRHVLELAAAPGWLSRGDVLEMTDPTDRK